MKVRAGTIGSFEGPVKGHSPMERSLPSGALRARDADVLGEPGGRSGSQRTGTGRAEPAIHPRGMQRSRYTRCLGQQLIQSGFGAVTRWWRVCWASSSS
jgi:hypothetical protein